MFCNTCHGDLKDFDGLINKMANCPFCGGVLVKKTPKVPQKGLEELCAKVVEKSGLKIFSNEDLLMRELDAIDGLEYEDSRDQMKVLCIKKVPSSMFLANSDGEKLEVLNECQKRLCSDLGFSFEACNKLLAFMQAKLWPVQFPLYPYFLGDSFKDPRDNQVYKTVSIGNQVWMAENLRYKCVGESNGLYNANAVNKYCAVRGWRVATKKDYEKLIASAAAAGYGDPSSVLMSKESWKKLNITPTDNFGFAVVPMYGYSDQAIFWCGDKKDTSNYYVSFMPGQVSFGYNSTDHYSVRLIRNDTSVTNKSLSPLEQ